MWYTNLVGTLFLFGALVIGGAPGSAQTNESGFVLLTPEQLKWVPVSDGVEVATLYGDPTKAGAYYVVQVKFPPYLFGYPHFHPEAHHVTVIKGTWYAGTGETIDVDKAVPLKAGSYMFTPAKAVHWEGAKDEEVIVEITGIGPVPTILAKPGGGLFFSIKK